MSESPAPDTHAESDFDAKQFRNVLGHFPTGVTIVTAIDTVDGREQPVGLTIGSFTSVSLDPPLVGFLPQTDSDTWKAIQRSGHFVVNELNCTQSEICWRFAKSGNEDERFHGVGWQPAPSGAPILDKAVAWVDCSIENVYEMGDHYFVLGRVNALDAAAASELPDEEFPLIFFKGTLGRFIPAE
jgi:3-hydroxy-9,10-secoandrosta-1,3,5(10)-triene-9,17-dione monooxygenase reductase component